ncbi:MAG: long-chain fatty acid--CoA ligase [Trueperella sp.]|nr:long-chain fatty acid--CoA ligase [Trueperella sp.]
MTHKAESESVTHRGYSAAPVHIEVPAALTIPKVLRQKATERPREVAIERKSALGNSWVSVTWKEFMTEIQAVARGLIALGVQPGDNVALMAHTSYEWALFDFAIQFAGGCAIPIYETSSTSQAEWIIKDAKIKWAIVENIAMRDVLQPIYKRKTAERVFVIAEDAVARITRLGSAKYDAEIDARIDAQNADTLWTVVYTSGTTGKPKGVELTQRNILHLCLNGPIDPNLAPIFSGKGNRTLLFLPMAHVFARFINMVMLMSDTVVGYSPDIRNLLSDLQTFKPKFMLGVPRVFEKVYNAADARAGSGFQLRMFRHFAEVAIEYSKALDTPQGPSIRLRAEHELGDRLIYSKIRDIFGGDLKYIISGGAPLGERLGYFFRGIGLPILEGYGLTESCAPTAVNRVGNIRIGSVGLPYPGTAMKISPEGEILLQGDHIFRGYRGDSKATAAAFTEDGWLQTGDMGQIDSEGFLWVTGRKKELIVTAGGKNVAPAPLEDQLRSHPIISQVLVIGDKKPFIAALITLDEEALPQWAASQGLEPIPAGTAYTDPQILAAIDSAVKKVNTTVSRAESIRKFKVLPYDFTTGNGYLTPSMKVRRKEVLEGFADEIEEIYSAKK